MDHPIDYSSKYTKTNEHLKIIRPSLDEIVHHIHDIAI